jgi:DNA-binding MarR family transcriptional regulator
LRTTVSQPDPADTLAPTARPTIRTSDQEMERALTKLLSRDRRHEVYRHIAADAGVQAEPRVAWLLLRVGEHPGWGRHHLARHLLMSNADLDRRLGELVTSGYARALSEDPSQPVALTEAGQRAFDSLFRVRHDRIARLAADWHPEHHPHLVALLTRLTHQLGASEEAPGHDLDAARSAPSS